MFNITPTPTAPLIKPQDSAPKKKPFLLIGLILGLLFAAYLGLAFFLVSTADGSQDLTQAKLLGMNAAGLLNTLVTGVHIVIALIALAVLIPLIISLFKMLLAKPEEIEKKKKAKKGLIIFGVILLVVLAGWITAFVYLEGKRDDLKINIAYPPILTEPAETLLLTAPITIKFDASHAPIDSGNVTILSYEWDFGKDEGKGTSQIVTHEYKKKGRYDVVLTITKRSKATGDEMKDTYSRTVTVENQALTADFSVDQQSGEAPLKVKFDASESEDPEGKIATYEWDFDGDGKFEKEFENEIKPTYTYEKIGTYEATLRITNLLGKFATAEKQIIVGISEEPEAVIEIEGTPTTFEKGVSYIFKGGGSTSPYGDIVLYDWDFGDGTEKGTTKTVSHVFAKEGTYDVILKVTDDKDKTGETTMKVVVGKKPGVPEAKMKTIPALAEGALALEGEVPFKVDFDGSDSKDSDNNIVEYEWDFDDDGKPDEFGKKVSHSFTAVGTYTVRLTVVDSQENYNSTTVGVKVLEQGMKAVLKATPVNGEVPLSVVFDASGSANPKGEISSYKWDFGDGTNPILGSAKISHKYTEIGEYKATVTVIGSDNAKETAEVNIVVRAIQVSACFDTNATSGKAPFTVIFDPGCSTGSITNYNWNFGDGETSTDVKPSHVFEKAGLYTVELEVLDNNSTVSTTTIEIKAEP